MHSQFVNDTFKVDDSKQTRSDGGTRDQSKGNNAYERRGICHSGWSDI